MFFSLTFFDLLFYSNLHSISSIVTFFTFTMSCTFFPSNETFTVPFQTFCLLTFTTPYIWSVEYVDIIDRISLSFRFDKFDRLITFRFMFAIIKTSITIAILPTKSIIMKTLTIQFKAMSFRALTRSCRAWTNCLRNLRCE